MEDGRTVPMGEYVDRWLHALIDAQAVADKVNKEEQPDVKLFEQKYVQDLLDALSAQLVRYIERPLWPESSEKIVLKGGRLVLSSKDENVGTTTKKARLLAIMDKILSEKGNDRGLYDQAKDILKNLSVAPESLRSDVEHVVFANDQLKGTTPGEKWRFFYDPKNVNENLALRKVYDSRVNLEDIDQFRNENGRYKNIVSTFNPFYRSLGNSLNNAARQGARGAIEASLKPKEVQQVLQINKLNTGPIGEKAITDAVNGKGNVKEAIQSAAVTQTAQAVPAPVANNVAKQLNNLKNQKTQNLKNQKNQPMNLLSGNVLGNKVNMKAMPSVEWPPQNSKNRKNQPVNLLSGNVLGNKVNLKAMPSVEWPPQNSKNRKNQPVNLLSGNVLGNKVNMKAMPSVEWPPPQPTQLTEEHIQNADPSVTAGVAKQAAEGLNKGLDEALGKNGLAAESFPALATVNANATKASLPAVIQANTVTQNGQRPTAQQANKAANAVRAANAVAVAAGQ